MIETLLLAIAVAAADGSEPLVFQENYWAEGSPFAADETLVDFHYPPGTGTLATHGPLEPLPVFVLVRGGNSNTVLPGQATDHVLMSIVSSMGFVGVRPNLATIEESRDIEDYTVTERSLARLVQYLRADSACLNIDPEKIACVGKSMGGLVSLAVGLKGDRRVLGSTDPVSRRSSRPSAIVSWSAPTDLTCLANAQEYLDKVFFPGKAFDDGTLAEKLAESPITWLDTIERSVDPHTCLVYNLVDAGPCPVNDLHSGVFGPLLKSAIDAYATQNARGALARSTVLLDASAKEHRETFLEVMDWIARCLDEAEEGPTSTTAERSPVACSGVLREIEARGLAPGTSVQVFASLGEAPFPIRVGVPGCAGPLVDSLGAPTYLGDATVRADGVASLPVFVPAGIGFDVLLRTIDAD